MSKDRRSSASGERAAISGYYKQYEYSACLIYSQMQIGAFEWLSVSDEAAGIFDDLLLGVNGRTWATQVKTERYISPVSLNSQLFSGSLLEDVADSFSSLEEVYAQGKVRLRYIFGGYFSTSDRALGKNDSPGPLHSAAFAEFVGREDLTEKDIEESQWRDAFLRIRERCKLESSDFVRMINCLELLDYKELEANKISVFPLGERKRIQEIADLLPKVIARGRQKRQWSEHELLKELGWTRPLGRRGLHEFPVPAHFQANEITEKKLLEALHNQQRGYLSLVGPPGTGKSTLLQRAVFSSPSFAVARYLAFLPTEGHGLGRAEAEQFLSDLTSELARVHSSRRRLFASDLLELRDEFSRQLDEANAEYQETGRKTVIIVDGLDHVPREESPHASFLRELPPANSIPDGVLLILGTQHLELEDLNASAKQQAKLPERLIEISPLPKAAIVAMADKASLPDVVDRSELYRACSGHPLTATYFIEALRDVEDEETAEDLLSDIHGLGRSLREIYSRVWDALQADGDTREVLGLLARTEGTIAAADLAIAVSEQAVEAVLHKAGFLLAKGDGKRVSIFHNSFRLFLAGQTAIRFGDYDPDAERPFYSKLAEIAARVQATDSQHWMELRYRSRGGDTTSVLQIGTPEYFRQSVAAFRPSNEIHIDLRLVYSAVKPTRDSLLLLNKLLAGKELAYRLESLSDLDFVALFLELGEPGRATAHALDGSYSGEGWTELVDYLWENGDQTNARRVFDAQEPLELLFGRNQPNRAADVNAARQWLTRAVRFRPIDQLKATIEALPDSVGVGAGSNRGEYKQRLFFGVGQGIVRENPRVDVRDMCDGLGLGERDAYRLTVEAALIADSANQSDLVVELLRDLLSIGSAEKVPLTWRAQAPWLAYANGESDLAANLLRSITVPALDSFDNTWGQVDIRQGCSDIYGLRLLAGLLGAEVLTEETENDEFLESVERQVTELAQLRVDAQNSKSSSASSVMKTAILFFANVKPDRFRAGSGFQSALGWFARIATETAFDHGKAVFGETLSLIDTLIGKGSNNLSNSQQFRLEFAVSVFHYDRDSTSARERIRAVEDLYQWSGTPHEVVSSIVEISRAFGRIGLKDEALRTLDTIHKSSLGYWLPAKKDAQYDFWAWAFLRAVKSDPGQSGDYSKEFGRFVLGMSETEGYDTGRRLVADLMRGAAHSPAVAASLFERLMSTNLTCWTELASCCLEGVTRNSTVLNLSVVDVFAHLVVPFYDRETDEFILIAFERISPSRRLEAVDNLAGVIERWCPPSKRLQLLEMILQAAPETEEQLHQLISDAREASERLRQKSYGSSAAEDDYAPQTYTATSLIELLELGEGLSETGRGIDYNYARTATELARTASKEEIELFIRELPQIREKALFLIASSRAMLEQGERVFSDELFEAAHMAASVSSWSYYVGGEKLELQRLRVERDGDRGRQAGFDLLLGELASGRTSGVSLFDNLSEILELVSVELDPVSVWLETEEHLKEYREYHLAEEVIAQEGISTESDLFAFLLAKSFEFRCYETVSHAREATKLVAFRSECSTVIETLLSLLEAQTDGAREAAALVYRLREQEHLRPIILAAAERLSVHRDFIVSNQAERVLKTVGKDAPAANEVRELPSFYEIVPIGARQAEDFEPPPGLELGKSTVWADDPWTWTASLESAFKLLRDATPFELEVLRRRCADLMRLEGAQDAYGREAEERISDRLRAMELKFLYRRPLFAGLQRAFGKMVKELVLARKIDEEVLPYLWTEVGGPSLSGYLFPVEPRPTWISPPSIPEGGIGELDGDAWLETAGQYVKTPVLPEEFVVAEKSLVRLRVWRQACSSTRVTLPSAANLAQVNGDLDDLPRLLSIDDLRPMYRAENSKLICTIEDFYFGDLSSRTLTMCPYLLGELGWTRSPSNPLEIMNASGDIVARTMRWIDGTDQFGYLEAESFGEGQALLVTKSERDDFEEITGPLQVDCKVIQQVERENKSPRESVLMSMP